jgi:hypothetical protein
MSIKFISLDNEWITQIKENFKNIPLIIAEKCDICKIPVENHCFVFPINSSGHIDIDSVLGHNIMPGIERKVKKRIEQLGIISSMGQPYLPIGSVVAVPYDLSSYLIVTSTIFLPREGSKIQNTYQSFYTALKMWHKLCIQNKTNFNLVITWDYYNTYGMSGMSEMSAKESANQIKYAYNDFIHKKGSKILIEYEDAIIFPNCDISPSNNYDNCEINELWGKDYGY